MSRKTKKTHPIIVSFFGAPTKFVSKIACICHGGEKNQFSYCGGWFTPQGLPTHEADMRREHSKDTSRAHPSGRLKLTGPVYVNYDKTSNVQEKNASDDKRETNIEDSVISDGDRELEEVKYDIHKNNAKKGEVYVEVEVNSNGEDNIKETATTSYSTQISIAQKIEIMDHFQAK